ncbi:hypothetical protein Tco_0635424 [Tanacetum coccineum]
MDNLNITMEEYIRLEEEQARRHGKVYNWETTNYGKIWYDEDVHGLRSVETEFPAIVFNDELSSDKTPSCEPTVSSLNNNEIDFRVPFDESNDEDYTPKVSCFNDLDFFKDFENEFPAIVYNDALTSKLDFLTELTLCPQHIDQFDLKDETSFLREVNIVTWNYLVNGVLLNLIKNLYVPFGIPFDPKRYYKDGVYTRMLRRPRFCNTPRKMDRADLRHTGCVASTYIMHTEGRKSGAKLLGGHFIRRLAHHFGLVSDDGLRGLSVVTHELPFIDMGAERQPVAADATLEGAEDAPDIDEGAQAVPAPIHAPPPLPLAPIAATAAPRGAEDALDINEGAQAVLAPIHAPPSPPPAAGRTMSQRFRRLVEEI